jgi:hypothetical protein
MVGWKVIVVRNGRQIIDANVVPERAAQNESGY